MAGLRTQNGRIGEQQMGKTPPSPCAPTAPSRPRHRLCLAVLTPQHELLSNTMALITSYCGAMRTHEHQMALITSEYVPADFAGVPREDGRGGHTAGLVTHLRTIDHGAPTRAHRCGTKEMACRQTRQGGGSISLVARAPQFVPD